MAIDSRFLIADGGSGEELPAGVDTNGQSNFDRFVQFGSALNNALHSAFSATAKIPGSNPIMHILSGSTDGVPVSGSKVKEFIGDKEVGYDGPSNAPDNYGSTDPTGYDQVSWALQRQWELDEAERQFNSSEAAKQRSWEKEMSDTAIQRAVADIKAAGLNPWLALNGGSLGAASTPSGASASSSSGSSKVPENYLIKLLTAVLSSASSILSAAVR